MYSNVMQLCWGGDVFGDGQEFCCCYCKMWCWCFIGFVGILFLLGFFWLQFVVVCSGGELFYVDYVCDCCEVVLMWVCDYVWMQMIWLLGNMLFLLIWIVLVVKLWSGKCSVG